MLSFKMDAAAVCTECSAEKGQTQRAALPSGSGTCPFIATVGTQSAWLEFYIQNNGGTLEIYSS